ncbi:MAG: hypothetical protein KDD95_00680, partial [Rhodobacteraceae bacterium]|nr:hypothetical protein [Paracoccaceae bacterium]
WANHMIRVNANGDVRCPSASAGAERRRLGAADATCARGGPKWSGVQQAWCRKISGISPGIENIYKNPRNIVNTFTEKS